MKLILTLALESSPSALDAVVACTAPSSIDLRTTVRGGDHGKAGPRGGKWQLSQQSQHARSSSKPIWRVRKFIIE